MIAVNYFFTVVLSVVLTAMFTFALDNRRQLAFMVFEGVAAVTTISRSISCLAFCVWCTWTRAVSVVVGVVRTVLILNYVLVLRTGIFANPCFCLTARLSS